MSGLSTKKHEGLTGRFEFATTMNERSFIIAVEATMAEKNTKNVKTGNRREPETRRRARMLKAAQKLFLRNGYSGAGMRDIAKTAGVSLGNLYNHFSAKEKIFDALIEMHSPVEEMSKLIEFIEREEFPGNFLDITRAIKNIVDRKMVFIRLTDIDGIEFGGKKTLKVIKKITDRLGAPLLEMHHRHLEQGLIRPIDPQIGFPFIVLVLASIFVLRNRFGAIGPMTDDDNNDVNHMIGEITDILLLGILPRDENKKKRKGEGTA